MLPALTTLKLHRHSDTILQLCLARKQVHNAINAVMMQELRDIWQYIHIHAAQFSCVVLTGEGEKAFCAGADLKERNNLDTLTWQQHHTILEQAMMAMKHCPVPIIAAVNGIAYGGGLELLLACDFAYTVPDATFGFPEVKLGIMPGAMGTQHLPRACGLRRAKEICLTGEPFSAQDALQWGIVNKLCSAETLLQEVMQLADTISKNAPLALTQIKKSLNATEAGILPGYLFEIESYNRLIPTDDRREGIAAFNEKRSPKFQGS